jgi:hypothetical protein
MSDKKLELILQMLAKAESTTPEEAEALTEHAERLMLKYSIDQAVIDERRAKKGETSDKIIEHKIEFTGAYRGEMLHLSNSVIDGLGSLSGLQTTRGDKVFKYWVVGFKSDVDQAVILITSLQIQAAVAVRAWWKAHKEELAGMSSYDQEKARRSFVHGFGTGAGFRLLQSRVNLHETISKGTEVVLVSRKEKVEAYTSDITGGRTARARNATGSDGAAVAGYAAGKNANTGSKAVGHTKQVGA